MPKDLKKFCPKKMQLSPEGYSSREDEGTMM